MLIQGQYSRVEVRFIIDGLFFFRNVYTKAMEQLKKGEVWLAHTMKMLGMKPWTYSGFAVFPNIPNRKTLTEAEKGLFKQEDESKVN